MTEETKPKISEEEFHDLLFSGKLEPDFEKFDQRLMDKLVECEGRMKNGTNQIQQLNARLRSLEEGVKNAQAKGRGFFELLYEKFAEILVKTDEGWAVRKPIAAVPDPAPEEPEDDEKMVG